MGVLSNLEPKKVFYYFEEITKIPHGSGNVEQISDFLVDFAKAHKLFYIQDAMKNIIMVKEATPGYEKEPVVILQGHMDMVAVQTPDCTMDMKTEGLKVGIDGDSVYAENTSLGGDDGIAVAYALALLDSEDIRHPRLEVIITVDEEVGMDGAREIDLSMLQGHRMINLDSEDEGIFLTSCAGGARVNCRFPMKKQELTGVRYEVEVSGLLGGHSGGEIHKERGNSNCILGRLLWKLSEKMPVGLVSADGGLADNAIPRQTKAVVVVEEKDTESLAQQVAALAAELGDELATKDPDVKVTAKRLADTAETTTCATPEATKRVAAFLQATPNGVQAMSADMPGLVQTSLNLGILKADAEVLRAEYSVRSSVESEKDNLIAKLSALVELTGGDLSPYLGDIREALQENQLPEEQERGLMHWYGKSDALSWKVKSTFFDVEIQDGQLWGVADCQLLESLEGDELGRLTTYLAGQAADGWGEGFEQQEIPVGKGLLYVHLWDGQDWEMTTTEPEQREEGGMKFG